MPDGTTTVRKRRSLCSGHLWCNGWDWQLGPAFEIVRTRNSGKGGRQTDRRAAQDLKQRGLLEDTIVWWSGEFGRTPYAQNPTKKKESGRDHNANGFTTWLAGGGVKPGLAYGATDEFGHKAVEDKVHMHDLHATLLHLLGMDHKKLTLRFSSRDMRLTDVHGEVIKNILA